MSMFNYNGAHLGPGALSGIETIEPQLTSIVWGKWEQQVIGHFAKLASGTVDSGNTSQTTHLRPGLLLGQTSDLDFTVWDPTASDGSQNISAILLHAVSMTFNGTTQPRWTGYILRAGNIKAKGIIIPGQATAGIEGQTLEFEVRKQLAKRFRFDDDVMGYDGFGSRGIVAKTANYTVVDADYGKEFTNTGATGSVTFTLPATAKKGLRFSFRVLADQTVTIAGSAGTVIAYNNLAATSLAFSTAGEKIGGYVEVEGNGSKWVASPRIWDGQTITIA